MSELTKEELATYTWTPSLAENTRTMKRRLTQAEMARSRTDLEAYPGEAEVVYNRLLAEAIGFASK